MNRDERLTPERLEAIRAWWLKGSEWFDGDQTEMFAAQDDIRLLVEALDRTTVTLTPESSEAVLKRLSEPACPTSALRSLLRGRAKAEE